ncbi:hypothetical protein [Streptomyces sp. NPDC001657]|uniref:hypothetical protein n=1 Tax=Streptomyces sp. NPDC001657 TaxID=3154522 RepID=UPI00332AA17A
MAGTGTEVARIQSLPDHFVVHAQLAQGTGALYSAVGAKHRRERAMDTFTNTLHMLYFFTSMTHMDIHLYEQKDTVVLPLARKVLLSGLAGAMSLSAVMAGLTTAQAAPQDDPPPPAASEMPSAVEDFGYPNAARILQDQKISLKRGDGHILLTGCDSAHDIMVKSRTGPGDYCFAVRGTKGYLTMELADAFGLWTEGHPVQATITADGKATVINAPKNDYKPLGEAGSSEKRSVLVELRVTS